MSALRGPGSSQCDRHRLPERAQLHLPPPPLGRSPTARPPPRPCSPQADAAALAECPNSWVPRDVVEGREPAITAAEQVVQQLYRRLVAPRLAPHADAFLGAEYWCQIYERGRGLGFHYDKVWGRCGYITCSKQLWGDMDTNE